MYNTSARALIGSNCIHCNTLIYIYEDEKNGMSKNVCKLHGGTGSNPYEAWTPTWVKKCECGATAAGLAAWGHSGYCPLYESLMNPKEKKDD